METEIRLRTQKIQDQLENIREKNKTIEILQDEVSTLQLELVHMEEKISNLTAENSQLVQRWLKKMNEEADLINSLNQRDEK
ncbi:Autophagy protein 16 [Smittium culicis]|uniref:Autophagy protein 16 n=2 Tax=Smittium culicis TaxID=133412 RepID=A0A1R1XM61_9FUNG|nr:Autophagy protein 16 [Smittium culicis]OMJ18409.1 Autophagy protein 16 [Smittium culicis]